MKISRLFALALSLLFLVPANAANAANAVNANNNASVKQDQTYTNFLSSLGLKNSSFYLRWEHQNIPIFWFENQRAQRADFNDALDLILVEDVKVFYVVEAGQTYALIYKYDLDQVYFAIKRP